MASSEEGTEYTLYGEGGEDVHVGRGGSDVCMWRGCVCWEAVVHKRMRALHAYNKRTKKKAICEDKAS